MEWSRLGAQSRCPLGLGWGRSACRSKCISGLHLSGPHAHRWVEALFAPLLPVTLSVKGQLASEHLHLAWCHEPRAAVIQVCASGEGRGQCRGAPGWSPGSVCLVVDSDQGEQGLDGCAAGQHPGTKATLPHCPRESQRRQRSSPSTHSNYHFMSDMNRFSL